MTQVISGAKLWVAGYDFSGDIRALGLDYAAEALDDTTIGDSTRSNAGGLKTFGMQHEGFWRGGANQVDEQLFSRIGLQDQIMTIAPTDGTEGEVAYSGPLMLGSYQPGGQIGELFSFTVSGEANDRPIRGWILHAGEESSNHNGTAFNFGQVAAGQKLYAALHVLSGSGDFTVKIASAGNEAFDSSPTDRITFTEVGTATARASEWATPVDGAITQAWWRMEATNPATRDWVVVMAIH